MNCCLIESDMAPLQALVLLILLVVVAITSVRAGRVAWWMRRGSTGSSISPTNCSPERPLIAQSTRGLARAAVWLTCAAGAAAISSSNVRNGIQ